MASSSSASSRVSEKYDVFLSFRAEDTLNNFTCHLYAALCRKKINTFTDIDDLGANEISVRPLLNAIEQSKIALIVFSKDYAASPWCLEELVKIIDCKQARDLMVAPVYYRVDPLNVRNQKGTFGEAFVKHEEKQSSEKVLRWRNALKEAANLSGYDSSIFRSDAELIENIVQEILEKLNKISPSEFKDLVGIESKIQELELLLRLKLKDVSRSVGIWGLSGIGKTTLARAVFSRISSQFESVYFQGNVREESERVGLNHLGKKLLPAIEKDIWAISESTFIKSRFCYKKVLIVLDDVPCLGQTEKLIGHLECFGSGSRIIVIARDKQVLKNCGVSSDNIYEVKGLLSDEALKLFSCHAFKLDEPPADYKDLSKSVMEFAKGFPLALKVLGSSLFEKTNSKWESTLYNLERISHPKIQDVLKISYDGLDCQEKDIFLDIACFFTGVEEKFVTKVLDAADFKCEVVVRNLFDKCLITINDCNIIEMHDLLRKMAEEIVKQESKDRSKRSRLWLHEDIDHVLRRNMGTEAIECISLDTSKIKEINLKYNAFLNMQNLRFLDFYWPKKSGRRFWDMDGSRWFDSYCLCFLLDKDENVDGCPYCSLDEENVNKVRALQGLEFSSHYLRYFRWFGYPLDSLPSNFAMENLFALIIPGSKIKQLWNGLQHLKKLKHINLMHSKHLIGIPDLSLTPNLESLVLEGCTSLIEVSSSIQRLNKLVMLNLKGCKSLCSLPTDIHSKFLTHLILSGCSNLKKAPKITCNMIHVYFDGTSIKELPLIEYPSRLCQLNLASCSRLESLPSSICGLESLSYLFISGCSKLPKLPQLGNLNKLQTLSLSGYRGQDLTLGSLWPLLSYLRSLSELDLSDCQIRRLPDTPGPFGSLERLNLSRNNFEWIPSSIKDSRLKSLDISYCERLKFLPKLPSSVSQLEAYNCTSLEVCSDSKLLSVADLNFGNCLKLENSRKILKAMEKKVKKKKFIGAIFLPGNKIPKWLKMQSAGSSLTRELPLNFLENNPLLSYTVCLVVTFPDPDKTPESFSVRYKLIGKDQNGKTVGSVEDTYWRKFQCQSLMLDHVILIRFDPIRWGRTETRFVTFDFSGENYNVKKCGLKYYFKDGIEESSNVEEERQPKKLKM